MSEKRRQVFLVLIILLMAARSPAFAAAPEKAVITAPPGSVERILILDALRNKMQHMHGLEMVFIVKYLKVQDGWAWIHTFPQSPDRENRYEDVSALLRKHGTMWGVAEIACAEEDNNQCIGSPQYFRLLKKRFPRLPAEILPE